VVTRRQGGITGLTVAVRIRDGRTTNSYLDFSDDTFKTSGWSAQTASLTDIGDGFYSLSSGLDLSAITNLPAATHYLVAEYLVNGSVAGSAMTEILMRRDVYDLALSLLQRSIADAETLPNFRSLGGAIQKLVNRVRIDATQLEVYEADDSTVSATQTLTTDANADPIVEADTA
jgi:hypothetical protein